MRDPKRIPTILKEIEKGWSKYPDLRLGQLIANISRHEGHYDPSKFRWLFFVEDEEFLQSLQELLKFLESSK